MTVFVLVLMSVLLICVHHQEAAAAVTLPTVWIRSVCGIWKLKLQRTHLPLDAVDHAHRLVLDREPGHNREQVLRRILGVSGEVTGWNDVKLYPANEYMPKALAFT